ncbi:MAG: sigma-54-dependent Fis family transcriptional regulator [Thermogemmatispora sp.]|uniref:sigma-54 interaction domain-containing protein n=1 Tax=Thermogemmatispora sp. TaxID=1968838 RepID=UPI0026321C4A|nr:sigma-54 dependent transcriptional regulator [Thermogemmatispora sp.]MBX5455943.1 sigma-54-dependent Fis family transcriptional regulator [Thermogemmatispora sp.]
MSQGSGPHYGSQPAASSSKAHEDEALLIELERFGLVIGRSQSMRHIATLIRQVAAFPTTTVLLQGESGTGKEVIAYAIHALSGGSARQFVAINCAAIPETLLETELFGVEAGAYTDARVTRDGYLARADGGTLFLDEIASMPLMLQSKLLRFLETRSFRRVGGTTEIQVRLRVISASNVDLATAVARKEFREDLFYRLKVFTIHIPPLREHPEDIAPLVEYFLRQQLGEEGRALRLSPEALALLERYSWPGNVRELRSVVQHGQIMCEGDEIRVEHLPAYLQSACSSALQRLQELKEQLHLPPEGINLEEFLAEIEQRFICEALERCNYNQVRAAALLGLSRDRLRYRLARVGTGRGRQRR